jgi:complex III assembly factor LYRM7
MALVAYRHILRSARIAFQGELPEWMEMQVSKPAADARPGDTSLLHAAQKQAREAFRSNASLAPEGPSAVAAIEHAEGVAKILRENIVQGKHVGDHKYSRFYIRNTLVEGSITRLNRFTELRIHDETERGDNDTVKMPNGQKVVIDGKTCADR